MPLYKVPTKKTHEPDAIDALFFCILAIAAVPAAAWMLAAIFNAAFF